MCKIQGVSSGEPLKHVITHMWAIHGKQKIGDKRSTQHPVKMIMNMIKTLFFSVKIAWLTTTPSLSVYRFNTSSCVRSTRRRVYRCARVAGVHGDVLNVHTTTCWIYTRVFFSVSHTTHTHHTDHLHARQREKRTEEKRTEEKKTEGKRTEVRRQKRRRQRRRRKRRGQETGDRRQKTEKRRERREERRREKMKETREKIRGSRDEEKMKLNCLINCPPSGN